jgi:hypothetical protein
MNVLRVLSIAAVVEAVSLLVLLVNLFTIHLAGVAAATGPIHGTAYLAVIASALLLPGASRTARFLAAVPGVGGGLALTLIARQPPPPISPTRSLSRRAGPAVALVVTGTSSVARQLAREHELRDERGSAVPKTDAPSVLPRSG